MHPNYDTTATMAMPYYPNVFSASTGECTLSMKQQPKEALVTIDGKEKSRKPIDPPPMVQLKVSPQHDRHSQYLQNPYIFSVVSLWKADKDEPHDESGDKALCGTLVSSLNRLKDESNKDGGFLIHGDISVRVQGSFRLRFTLFELQSNNMQGHIQCLGHVDSSIFKVLSSKDFKGLAESTHLSRTFSDQGVRLRLRKEAKGMMGRKRSRGFSDDEPADALTQKKAAKSGIYEQATPKRPKTESDDQDNFGRSPIDAATPYAPPFPASASYASSYSAPNYNTPSFTPPSFSNTPGLNNAPGFNNTPGLNPMSRTPNMQHISNSTIYNNFAATRDYPSLPSGLTLPYSTRTSMMHAPYGNTQPYTANSDMQTLNRMAPRSQPQPMYQQQQQQTTTQTSGVYPSIEGEYSSMGLDPYADTSRYPSGSS
jgi:hypothetical protein